MEDARIVDLYLLRDEQAIGQTAMKYGKRLRGLAYAIVQDLQTSEECENDTYIQVWNSIPPHTPRDHFFPFLAKITRQTALNCCRDRNRKKRSAVLLEWSSELEQCIPAPDDCARWLDETVLAEAINGFLAGLKPEKRNIFLRRYWFFDTVSEISNRYGISESKVKVTLHRCRTELRKHLQKEGIEP